LHWRRNACAGVCNFWSSLSPCTSHLPRWGWPQNAPKCSKMPALGNPPHPVELGWAADHSPKDIPTVLGGQAHPPRGWHPSHRLLWEEGSPSSWCPQWRPHPAWRQRFSRSSWDGHSVGKGLFPLTPHDPQGLLGLLRGSGGPCEGGTGCLAPKMQSGDSERLSQLLGDSWGPFICPAHLNAAAGLWGFVGGAKRRFVSSLGTNSTHRCLPPPTQAAPSSLPAAGAAESQGALPFTLLFIQLPEPSLSAQGRVARASSNTHFCVQTRPPRPRTSSWDNEIARGCPGQGHLAGPAPTARRQQVPSPCDYVSPLVWCPLASRRARYRAHPCCRWVNWGSRAGGRCLA